jgi:Transposase DDE domain
LGEPETLLADSGYISAANVAACAAAGIEPLIAMGRQPHHPPLAERFKKAPSAPENPTPVEAMAHRLQTPEGRKLYALRKQIPEPVFGVIKSALGFRQFSLRRLDKVRGEWSLVTMAWNLKRDVCPRPHQMARPSEVWQVKNRRAPADAGDHHAIEKRPSVRRKLKAAKSPSAFCCKTSVRQILCGRWIATGTLAEWGCATSHSGDDHAKRS